MTRHLPAVVGAQATTKHAAETASRPITDPPNEVPMSPVLDLRGEPVTGAQCRFDPDLHIGPDVESPEEQAARELVAAEVCETCPLHAECFELAMRVRPEFGVWAGYTAAELAALADDDLAEVA
ncbi:WhiB family transcriptional regulator [Spirillospora sp. CA-294931]|uniref:WhiB family transcriptional regulator n=1 Tax=Spirillospora sp. CA-294931 TaxID=3240042 RepID=UPI003D9456A7